MVLADQPAFEFGYLHLDTACLNAGEDRSLIVKLWSQKYMSSTRSSSLWPGLAGGEVVGSGNLGTPWARMHLVSASAWLTCWSDGGGVPTMPLGATRC